MGLKMECNTRRFATDDRRELQYRVEVQNRVYKKEMAALDAEIAKLQRLLDSTASTASSVSAVSAGSALLLHSLHQQQESVAIVSAMDGPPAQDQLQRNLSIGGGLPLLLLSVLPPVIPRASWPSAQPPPAPGIDGCSAVAFSSQPQLSQQPARLPAIDLFNLRLTHQLATANGRHQSQASGLFGRLRGLFAVTPPTPTPPSAGERRESDASVAEGTLRKHLNRLTGLMAQNQQQPVAGSCNALHSRQVRTNGPQTEHQHQQRQHQRTKSGSALDEPFIVSDEFGRFETQRSVVFRLPRKTSAHSASRRDRVRGSPRFPHRIVPSRGSLNALSLAQSSALRLARVKCKSMDESSSFTSASSSDASIASSVASMPTVTPPPCEADSLSIVSVIGTGVYDEDDAM